MRMVIQRVKEASVVADGQLTGRIGQGLLVFFGVHSEDASVTTQWMADKLVNLRIFSDDQGKMNLSVQDVKGQILVVSQFTLYGDCSQGRRPDFGHSAPPQVAEPIYDKFVREVGLVIPDVATGRFGAMMEVSLVNDGPVTFIVER